MIEIYKDVVGYEGIYKVSNLGNVKSIKFDKEKILNPVFYKNGYYSVNLSIQGIVKKKLIHQLVAESFLNHKICGHKLVINHINFNRIDNSLNNLEITTSRENLNRSHIKSSSKYVGVCWDRQRNKWRSRIIINGKSKHLGHFKDELEASEAYQLELSKI